MLAKEKPDLVSVAVWPHLHCDAVLACADAGVKMVHCEKPIALTWGDARRMVAACRDKGVQLTFDHQRRFLEPFRKAKQLIASGAIGKLQRLESKCHNMYDWGTHWLDMLFFLNEETPVDWVIGQVELRGNHKVFDAPMEGQGLTHFTFRNGVRAFMVTGFEADFGCEIRAVGSAGQLELRDIKDQPLRLWKQGQSDWENLPCSEGLHGDQAVERAILDAIGCLRTGREPELAARKALQSTEIIFATWESSRRRGRVDLPLTIDDSPMADMLATFGTQATSPAR
jgi:predicted dehydrogenase